MTRFSGEDGIIILFYLFLFFCGSLSCLIVCLSFLYDMFCKLKKKKKIVFYDFDFYGRVVVVGNY